MSQYLFLFKHKQNEYYLKCCLPYIFDDPDQHHTLKSVGQVIKLFFILQVVLEFKSTIECLYVIVQDEEDVQ